MWIRSQDRMILVPCDNPIKIDEVSYVVNKKEIENIHKENQNLYEKFPKNGQGLFSKHVLEEEFKKVRLAIPPIEYGVKGHCLILLKTNLGTYTTKERALEVLDEIQKAVNDFNNIEEFRTSDAYEMPKE